MNEIKPIAPSARAMRCTSSFHRIATMLTLTCALGACAPLISSVLPIEGTRRMPVGTTSVGGAAAYVGNFFGIPGAGAFARVSHQQSENLSFGGDLGGGVTSNNAGTSGTVIARGHVSYSPTSDNIALNGGVSAGVGNRGGGLALDVGARFGFAPTQWLDLWAGQSIGYSLVFFDPLGTRLQTHSNFLSATSIAAGFRVTPAISVGPALSMLIFADENGAWPRGGSGGFVPGFVPSIFVQSALAR